MFKILIIQALYNLSDGRPEFQVLDYYSFSRFLGTGERVKANVVELLFTQFLRNNGFKAQKGQIVDASIVRVPIQRNSCDENKSIKAGNKIKSWSKGKRRQKYIDARWTKKNTKSYFGYKNHISVDAGHKFIRCYEVTDASVHDSLVFTELLNPCNTSRDVWADSAYRLEESLQELQEQGFCEHIQRKGLRHKKLLGMEKRGNRTRSSIRSCVARF